MSDSQKAKQFSIGCLVRNITPNMFPIRDGDRTIAYSLTRENAWMVRDGLNAAVDEGLDVSTPVNLEHLVGRHCMVQSQAEEPYPTLGIITGGSCQQVFVNWGKKPAVAILDSLLIEGEDFELKTQVIMLP